MKFSILILLALLLSCRPIIPIENPNERHDSSPQEATVSDTTQTLRIIVIDVGQGDATLVMQGSGSSQRTLLIDAGKKDEGYGAVLPTLASLGVTHLDWIIATHYDADHIGGIPEVLAGGDQILGTEDDLIPSFGFFDRGDGTDKASLTYAHYVEVTSPYRKEAVMGQTFDLGSGATATIVVANGHFSNGQTIHLNPDEENESSIGLLIEYGNFRYFTAGDLTGGGNSGIRETKDMETITGEIIGDIDVLHVDHHGSETSSHERFLEEVTPEAAIISVGKDNDYGHPKEGVLERLNTVGAANYRTDQMGTIEIRTDGKGFEIDSLSVP